MPSGEVFYSPIEDSAEGVDHVLRVPGCYQGRQVEGVSLRFEGGRVVEASARLRRGVPAGDARHGRGRTRPRRVRHRLQPRHPDPHAEHALRREDRRAPSISRSASRTETRRDERERDPLGHGQGPAQGRADRARRRSRPGDAENGACETDSRVLDYAKLLVERGIDPKPGWQVMVLSTPLARPVVEEVQRELARRGAYCLLRLDFGLERFPGCRTRGRRGVARSSSASSRRSTLHAVEAHRRPHHDRGAREHP